MTESPVRYETRDGVAWITLNRPAVLNALNTELAATVSTIAHRIAPGIEPGASRANSPSTARGSASA